MPKTAERFFKLALRQAQSAGRKNEVPIGAVIVQGEKVIAQTHNQTEAKGHFAAHAELLAIQTASRRLKTKYLNNCELYITLEPCLMCLTAARLARIPKIHFLLNSEKFGRAGKAYAKIQSRKSKSILTQDAKHLLASFFRQKR